MGLFFCCSWLKKLSQASLSLTYFGNRCITVWIMGADFPVESLQCTAGRVEVCKGWRKKYQWRESYLPWNKHPSVAWDLSVRSATDWFLWAAYNERLGWGQKVLCRERFWGDLWVSLGSGWEPGCVGWVLRESQEHERRCVGKHIRSSLTDTCIYLLALHRFALRLHICLFRLIPHHLDLFYMSGATGT